MSSKDILKIISRGTLAKDPIAQLSGSISSHLFSFDDILEVLDGYDEEVIFIRFKNINGSIPFRFLDTSAKEKILKWKKINSSLLWKQLK